MKLTRVTVRNFRSYVATDGEGAVLEVGDGLNLLVGPNNCGKSNLLRSIALALEDSGGTRFEPALDIPQQKTWAYPTITLTFRADTSKSFETTLLKYLQNYEESAGTRQTYARNREIHYRVRYTKDSRDDYFVTRGAGNRRGDNELLEKCRVQFRKCIRFIYLRSGENLRSFLSGTFHELLHTVLEESLGQQVHKAEERRKQYTDGLRDDLLKPLGEYALQELRDVMTEIRSISITPFTPSLTRALSEADILVGDTAATSIVSKGTGVRGALLVALLAYIAKNSRRSLILAVEEPEAFLHPQAQEELRSDLARLAEQKGISLLVTTHSPFLLDRSNSTQIVPVSKDVEGVSVVGTPVNGDESHVPAITCLFGESITPAVLERVEPLKGACVAVLFLEGYTDRYYFECACQISDRTDLLEGLDIRYDGGAEKTALQALLFRHLVGDDVPMLVLLDWDTSGKSARELLRNKFKWPGAGVRTYRDWLNSKHSEIPVEAEDMFSQSLLRRFVNDTGEFVLSERQRYSDDTWHYGFTQAGKTDFCKYVKNNASAKDVSLVVKVLEDCRKVLGL